MKLLYKGLPFHFRDRKESNLNTHNTYERMSLRIWFYSIWTQYSWIKKLGVLGIIIVVLLYYPVGMFVSDNIDTKMITAKVSPYAPRVAAKIVLNQVHDGWVPGKPWYFPSYFLENMPAFQIGIIKTISLYSTLLYDTLGRFNNNPIYDVDLTIAYNSFKYPSDIWTLGSSKVLSQDSYKNAAIALLRYSKAVSKQMAIYRVNRSTFLVFLKFVKSRLNEKIQSHRYYIQNSGFISTRVDQDFYETKGVFYTLFNLNKAFFKDSKSVLDALVTSQNAAEEETFNDQTKNNLMKKKALDQQTKQLLQILYLGMQQQPWVVLNPKLDRTLFGNALNAQMYYLEQAVVVIDSMIQQVLVIEKRDNTQTLDALNQ